MLELPGYFIACVAFVFGLIVGSFLNVVIHRLPLGESVVLPASHCTECNAEIKPYDNIPVLSYALLRGRCRACGAGISPIYPAVELITAILYLALYLKDGLSMALLTDIVFVSLIIPLVFIDFRHKILPNLITYPGFILLLALRLLVPDPVLVGSMGKSLGFDAAPAWLLSLGAAILGALAGGGSLWLVRALYFAVRKVEGMGLGDIKMMIMVGAFLGWPRTILTIFIAALFGSLIGIAVIKLRGGTMRTEIPFGVFLGPAGIAALLFGHELIVWYTSLYRY